jgi:hypothetical protein
MSYNPDMSSKPRSALDRSVKAAPSVTVGSMVRVKALEPLTSTGPPTLAQVTESSKKGIMLRVRRRMLVGSIVQLHLERDFSLWKIFCCVPNGNSFHVGLEFVEIVSAEC